MFMKVLQAVSVFSMSRATRGAFDRDDRFGHAQRSCLGPPTASYRFSTPLRRGSATMRCRGRLLSRIAKTTRHHWRHHGLYRKT